MDDTQIPKSYRERIGCHSCSHVFEEYDYESQATEAVVTYYCTYGAPERPPCGSASLGEDGPLQYANAAYGLWRKWSAGRCVQPWGTCEHCDPPHPDDGG